MIGSFLQTLEAVFSWLVEASWQASILAALVVLLQFSLRGKLNPRWRHALWLLVIARLILPALPESALSLFQFAPLPPSVITRTVTEPIFDFPAAPLVAGPSLPAISPAYPFSLYTILALLWLTGAVGFLILTWCVNRRFGRHVAKAPAIREPHLLQIAAAAEAELGILRSIRLIESAQVQGPAIMGLVHPTLILPPGIRARFTDQEIRFIFLHELAHLKRGDLALQWLIAVLQILHWFNPALWYAFRRMRTDRETATDALVLSRAGEAQKETYGHVLIKLLEHYHQRHSLPTLICILEDKDQFKRRFQLIARFTTGAYGWSVIGVVCLSVLSVICLTAKRAPGGNKLRVATMSETEAASKGIAALVNGVPIYWSDVTEDGLGWIQSRYTGDSLKRKLAEYRYFQRDERISRVLDVRSAQAEGYRVPSRVVDERIDFGIKGYHGDKAAFVENLRRNGETLEQFNEQSRDDDVSAREISMHVQEPLDEFVRTRFPGLDFKAHPPTKDQDTIIRVERIRLENKWRDEQRAHAVIQLFDDPEYPGAKPPDFISKSAAPISSLQPPPTVTWDSTSTPTESAHKPAVKITITLIEIGKQAYDQQAQAMDEALRSGNLPFFRDRITRTTNVTLRVGQKGWYSEGEVMSYVASAGREKEDGKPYTVLKMKAIFVGFNAAFRWTKNGSSINSTWLVSVPVGLDPLPLGSDIPRSDVPQPFYVPRLLTSRYADNAWDIAPGKAHGFWVGDTAGWLKAAGGTLEERIKHETPSRLAVFLTATPDDISGVNAKEAKELASLKPSAIDAAKENEQPDSTSATPVVSNSRSETLNPPTETASATAIQGTVLDPNGKPAAGAKIGVGGVQPLSITVGKLAESNPGLVPCSRDGKFSIAGVSGVKTIFAMDASGYAVVPIETFNGKITLKPWARVKGDALVGLTPANQSHVVFHSYPPSYISGNGVDITAVSDTDGKGAFVIDQVPEGIAALMFYPTPLGDPSTEKATYDKKNPSLPMECQHIQTVSGQTTRTILGGPGVTVTGKLPTLPTVKFIHITEFWSRSPAHDPALPALVQSDREK